MRKNYLTPELTIVDLTNVDFLILTSNYGEGYTGIKEDDQTLDDDRH